MREHLNPHTLAADARMRRALFKGVFLYVEGSFDEKFYGMFTDHSQCQIIIAFSQLNVIEACRILETASFSGVVGIIDADFNHLEGKSPNVASVFQTDAHDAECLMLSTGAFERVITEFASKEKLAAWKSQYGIDIKGHLLDQAGTIGALLWHSNRTELNLRFQELEPKAFVDDETLKVDIAKLITHVKNKSQLHGLSDEKLASGLSNCTKDAYNKPWQVVRGCDLIDFLSFAFRKAIGTLKSQQAAREQIEAGLRLAYLEDDFSRTALFCEIRKWEAAHAPFQVFRKLRQQNLEL